MCPCLIMSTWARVAVEPPCPLAVRPHVQPYTSETRSSPCPCGGLQVVPCESMRFGAASTHAGMDVHGARCSSRTCPCRHGRACAQPGQVNDYRGHEPILAKLSVMLCCYHLPKFRLIPTQSCMPHVAIPRESCKDIEREICAEWRARSTICLTIL